MITSTRLLKMLHVDGFDSITAVKEKAVVQVDEDLTSRQGPRLAEGLEAIAKAIYPEAFSE